MRLTSAAVELPKRYNVAPTQTAPIVRGEPNGGRVLSIARWGLIPSWSKDSKIAAALINARGETVAAKPSFRSAFKARRCLIPASGFYEWQAQAGKKAPKQAFYIRSREPEPIVFAGLWEQWKSPEGETIETYTVITTQANALLGKIHERMPVILKAEDFETWLDPSATPETLMRLLVPCADDRLECVPVTSHVNSARNEGPRCIEPVEEGEG